jgi:hypothetical protein
MIEPLSLKRHKLHFLAEFICLRPTEYDFYFTETNTRYYITDLSSLKKLLRQSSSIFVSEERGDFKGIILLWKSDGGGKVRHYVKINADSLATAEKLITVLTWNATTDIFAKLRKDNIFLPPLRNKSFKFEGSRGQQILLHRKYVPITKERYECSDTDDNN